MRKCPAAFLVCLTALTGWMPVYANTPDDAQVLYHQLTRRNFVEGRFTQRRELSDIPTAIESQGRFMIWRGHGLYWETTRPLFHATTFTPGRTYQWHEPGAAEVADDGAFGINRRISSVILALFEGDFEALKDDFDVALESHGPRWTVTLEPANRYIEKALRRIVITGADTIRGVRLESASGDTTSIDLEVTGGGEAPDGGDTDRLSPEAIRACCIAP